MDSAGRWRIARAISEEVLRARREDVHAIGVHGSLAHGDDDEFSDIDLVVVTERPVDNLPSVVRRVEGVIVDFGVTTADDYMEAAKTLTRKWPLDADQYLTTRALHDPHHWHDRLREAHRSMIEGAKASRFLVCAREALLAALAYAQKARREEARGGSAGVVAQYVGSAAVEVALAEGLMARTYYRSSGDALKRNKLDQVSLSELLDRLKVVESRLEEDGVRLDSDPRSLWAG
ncbi:MAG: nucleotidyltransferase domain-containing protein [Euryarchaeota archaeon]|nr:nucleotidyltransferase domain-containing protein [Euryarchaeota archaeon]